MLRKTQYEEDWERRKAYLVRSFFQDVPYLSPIPEEEESNNSLPSRILPPSTNIREPLERPCSPLPPLIIEKEPKQANKHDEPPEFYRKLEKRVLKFYRRLFIEDRSDVSNVSDSSDTSVQVTHDLISDRRSSFGEVYYDDSVIEIDTGIDINHTPKWNSKAGGLIDFKENEKDQETEIISSADNLLNSFTDDEQIETQRSNNYSPKNTSGSAKTENLLEQQRSSSTASVTVDVKTKIMKEDRSSSSDVLPKSTSDDGIYEEDLDSDDTQPTLKDKSDTASQMDKASSSSTSIGYRQVTFQADVHRDATEIVAPIAPSLIYEQGMTAESIRDDNNHGNNGGSAELEKNNVSDIETPNNSDDDDDDDDDTQPIEVMRTPRMHLSAGSIHKKSSDGSQRCSNDVGEISRSLEVHTECDSSKESSHHDMDFEESIDFDILRASILNQPNDFCNKNGPIDVSSCKRKSSASLSSPSKRARCNDVCVQANFEEMDLNRQILMDNVFVGVPSVFRLCSCANHLCR